MRFNKLWQRWIDGSRPSHWQNRRQRAGTGKRPPLSLETLESRITPSVTVSTTLDPTTPIAGQVSLREAIDMVNAGQVADNTIILPAGSYLNTQGALNVTHSLILQGAGAGRTALDGGGTDRVVLIDPAAAVDVQISGVTVRGGNTSGNGGGIDIVANANVTVQNCIVSDNTAGLAGGGIDDSGSGSLTISGCTLSGNQARGGSGGGGCDYVGTGLIQVANSIFSDNISNALLTGGSGGGGGLEIDNAAARATIVNSIFSGNDSTITGGGGLDVSNGLTLTVLDSTFTGNQSGGFGGGLFVRTSGTNAAGTASSLVNDTFAGNRSALLGGGLQDFAPGDLNLTSDTITGNLGLGGGSGVGLSGGTAFFLDTLDAGNYPQGNGRGTDIIVGNTAQVSSQGGNLIGDGTAGGFTIFPAGTPNAKGDFVGTPANYLNPQLGPLTNNGGPLAGAPGSQQVVPTEAPSPGSLAIGNGIANGAPITDERGFNRVVNGHTDIGAFQFQDVPLHVTITPAMPTAFVNGTETFTITVSNTGGHTLPADNSTLTLVLSAGLTTSGPLTLNLAAIPGGQSQTFTVTATASALGTQLLTATVTSLDANPSSVSGSVTINVVMPTPLSPTTNPATTHSPIGSLTLFAFGFGPTGIDLFDVDSAGEVFALPFMGDGTPLFLNNTLHLPLTIVTNGRLLALLAGSNGQDYLIDIINPFNPLIGPAVLSALMLR